MKHKDIVFVYAVGAVAAFFIFLAIQWAVRQAFSHHRPTGYNKTQETRDDIRQQIKETKERQDDMMDEQGQKLSEYEAQQRKKSAEVSETRYKQRTMMQDQQQRIKDMQRR